MQQVQQQVWLQDDEVQLSSHMQPAVSVGLGVWVEEPQSHAARSQQAWQGNVAPVR